MPEQSVQLSDKEMALVRQYAQQQGISEDEAATALFSQGLAQRMRAKTNRPPARVYDFRSNSQKT